MKIEPVAVEQAGELMLIGMGGVFIVHIHYLYRGEVITEICPS